MKWEGNRQSDNVEDHRGEGGGGGGGGFGFGGRSVGIGTIVIALLGSWIFGINPMTMLNLLSGGGGGAPVQQQQSNGHATPANDRQAAFVKTVLADTEDTWTQLFREQGRDYPRPKLNLFTDAIPTACGTGQSAAGPFYCPADQEIYIDLAFYRLMQERFNVSSEFAQAYVIAHEVGHHVQHTLGIMDKVDVARKGARSEREANALSVKVELQADCLAGVWAYHANKSRSVIEAGDVEGALKAATAIGDDALQQQSRGRAVPDSFTHGSSQQRVTWFSRGLETGKVTDCDTFAAGAL